MVSGGLLLLLASTPVLALRGSVKSALLTDMRPEVVNQLLTEVENKWTKGFVMVMRNQTDSASAYATMEASCVKVARSIIAGSDGDEDRVAEYMKDVCISSATVEGKKACQEFAAGVDDAMIGDAVYNRERLDLPKFCKSFWSKSVQAAAVELKAKEDANAEAVAAKKDADAKAAAEKKAEEEKAAAEKKEADEKAAAEKKAAEEKAAAEKKEAEENAAVEKKAAVEKAAEQKKAKDAEVANAQMEEQVKAASVARDKVQNMTAVIMKSVQDEEAKMDSAVQEARNLTAHARTALRVATKKEAQAKVVKQHVTAPSQPNATAVQKNMNATNVSK